MTTLALPRPLDATTDDVTTRRVWVDLTAPGAQRFGVGLVARAFAAELARRAPGTEVRLLAGPDHAALWRRTLADGPWLVDDARPHALPPLRATEVLLAPSGGSIFAPLRPTFVLLGAEAEHLVGGHFDELEKRALGQRLEAARCADRLFVTRDALRGPLVEALGVPPERVRVVRLEAAARLAPADARAVAEVRARHGLGRPFLLHAGGARPEHNLTLLLAGWRLLLERHAGPVPDLVLAVRGDEYHPGASTPPAVLAEVAARAARFGLGTRVHVLGSIDDAELAALYTACDALVLPWLYQGLDLGVREGLRFARPLLLSDSVGLPAGAEAAAVRFDARRPESIARALAAASDPSRRAALTAAARAARGLEAPAPGLAQACLERLDELASRPPLVRVAAPELPVLSVVTPSFEQGAFIERTLRSVLGQSLPGLEYVVMDGGSRDGTLDVLRRYEGALRYVSRRDGGQADAINAGLRATRAGIVGWLNSDDVYYDGALAEVVRFFEAHPEVDLVYGEADHIDTADAVIEPYPTEDWDLARLTDVCFLCQPAVFLRRRVLDRFGMLDAGLRYCMDYEFWLRVGPHVRTARLPRRLAGSRLHLGAKTLRARVAVHAEINNMLRRRLGYVPERWLYNYAWAVVDAAGCDRARLEDYAWRLAGATLWAFVRWRGRVPRHILQLAAGWLREVRARRREARR